MPHVFWTKYIRGSTDWNAAVKIEDKADKKQASILIESSLQGITLGFPEPFSKIGTDIVPLN